MRTMIHAFIVGIAALTMISCGGAEDKPAPPSGDTATTGAGGATQAPTSDTTVATPATTETEAEHGEKEEKDDDAKEEASTPAKSSDARPQATAQTPTTSTTPTTPTTPAPPSVENKPTSTTPPSTPTTTPAPAPSTPPAQTTPTAAGGKAIFVEQKCNTCHGISSQGISRTAPPTEGQDPPKDLSRAGKERDADWIVRWLQKKESVNGKKHIKGFKGGEEDLLILARWLAGLK